MQDSNNRVHLDGPEGDILRHDHGLLRNSGKNKVWCNVFIMLHLPQLDMIGRYLDHDQQKPCIARNTFELVRKMWLIAALLPSIQQQFFYINACHMIEQLNSV